MINPCPTIVIAGSFDPLRYEDILLIKKANNYGHVYIILWNDASILKIQGTVLLIAKERQAILKSITEVQGVIISTNTEKLNIAEELSWFSKPHSGTLYPPTYYGIPHNVKDIDPMEEEVCKKRNIKIIDNLIDDIDYV